MEYHIFQNNRSVLVDYPTWLWWNSEPSNSIIKARVVGEYFIQLVFCGIGDYLFEINLMVDLAPPLFVLTCHLDTLPEAYQEFNRIIRTLR